MPRARRLTAEEAAERLGLSVSRVTEMARNRELGRKEGGRWTFSEADVTRVAREREERAKALKLRRKLENDRRRMNGLPPKRRKQPRRPRVADDEPRRPRRQRGLTVDDIGALAMLDSIVAQERELERRYSLPFRAPHTTEVVLHRCTRCGQPLLLLIFGDSAVDAEGLDAYGRLMEGAIRQNGVPAYVLGRPSGAGDDAPSLLRRVWPESGEVTEMTPRRWDAFIEEQSQGHGCGGR